MFRGGVAAATTSTNYGSTSSKYPSVDKYPTRGPRKYPFRLNFYSTPPIQEVTIEQFETWAIDRLRVLAEIESCLARNRPYAELKEIVGNQAKQYLPLNATTAASSVAGGPDIDGERMKDHVSHFVLRLAFCRTEDLRKRFVKAETTLFRLRFENDDASEKERFLKTLDLNWETVSSEEKNANRSSLMASNPKLNQNSFESEQFFKVHWTRILDLVEKRKVFLKSGTAWVPMREQASLIIAEFSNKLSKNLEMTARALPKLDEDDRILPLLSHLSMGFMAGISRDLSANAIQSIDGGVVTADQVDSLIKQHAPLCMRSLHESLQSNAHLRYNARAQYNTFLKDIGLPVEDALIFWRRSFRNTSDDKFNKEYKYNIRWDYGLEGRRLNVPAKNCLNIIMNDQPGPSDNHGCPFRHYSPQNLQQALTTMYGINFADQAEILNAVKNGNYHVGCTRLFEITHKNVGIKKGDGLGQGESVDHPNRYFERSYTLIQNGGLNSNTSMKKESSPTIATTKVKSEEGQSTNDVVMEIDHQVLLEQEQREKAAAAEATSAVEKIDEIDEDELMALREAEMNE